MSLIFHIFFIGCLQLIKNTDRSHGFSVTALYPFVYPPEIMLYTANTRIFWPIKNLYKDFYKVDRIPIQSGLTRHFVVWTAIVISVCLAGGSQLLKLGESNRPAVSAPVDRPRFHKTFVPNPNQPPVFTRGFGTR